jgi:hypothetical protein
MLNHDIPVESAPGTLPAFWDRQAVFVANLLGMFFGNEAGTRALAAEIGEADSYGGRLLPIVDLLFRRKDNLLVLERAPDSTLAGYFQGQLGLSLPTVEVLSHRDYLTLGNAAAAEHPVVRRIAAHAAPWMDGYVTDETLAGLAARLGKRTISSTAGSHEGNNKRLLYEEMAAAGLPMPATYFVDSPEEILPALMALRGHGYRSAVVKSAIGASGIGLHKIRDLDRGDWDAVLAALPGYFFHEGTCLVQGWVEPGVLGVRAIRSPSVQIFASDEGVVLYDITEQILSHHSIHEGNEAPPPYLHLHPEWRGPLLDKGAWAARWLHGQGYRGTASADFLIVEKENGQAEIQICEINARVTGATYPAVLARHFLPHGFWLLRNLRFESPLAGGQLLEALRTGGGLFPGGGARQGILPVNFNFGKDGLVHKGQFLCLAEDAGTSHGLLKRACQLLPCTTERD